MTPLKRLPTPPRPHTCLLVRPPRPHNPRLSNAMGLPPELLDEIIGYIPLRDEKSFRSCSLVAKWWIHPSQRRLFEAVRIWGSKELKLWLGTISPTNVGVLQLVRSLTYTIANTSDSPHESVDPLCDYLPSFHQLRSLAFFTVPLPSLTQIGAYNAFQHILSYLSLTRCTVTASGVVALVNYFPNLAHLDLYDLYQSAHGPLAHSFSRPLRTLSIAEFYTDDGLDFIDRLMSLHPRCDEVTVCTFYESCPSLAQRVIDGVEGSVKRLKIKCDPICVSNVSKSLW